MSSTHRAEVFVVEEVIPHHNADSLEVVRFYNYVCVVRKGDYQAGSLACYIPPDSLVPVASALFSFLEKRAFGQSHRYAGLARIKAQRLRGVMSQGLVVPAPEGSKPGDDVADQLGILHYEPQEPVERGAWTGGKPVAGPNIEVPVYDLESWFRYSYLLHPGEEVFITEKIHGCNLRVVWDGGKLHVGSRKQWKLEEEGSVFWRAISQLPMVIHTLSENPGLVLYGEVFGDVQDLKYGHEKGQVSVRFFDALVNGRWAFPEELLHLGPEFPLVPLLYRGPYDESFVRDLIEGQPLITAAGGNHIAEGVVIHPSDMRYSVEIGRVKLKAVSPAYLEKAK